MQKLVGYSGESDFSHGKSMYTNPMDLGIFASHGHHIELYSLPCKRSRINAPFIPDGQIRKKPKTTIEILPDECLFEIFKRLNGNQERSSCASVSKHWLNLISTIRNDEFTHSLTQHPNAPLSRSLKGKKATDIRLLAIAIGASGGLGSLSINGNNVARGVTNLGLKAISRNCPSLTDLSLWNLSSISDEGIIEIANECHNLEKLDFCQIPISDNSLIAFAKNCPNLKELSIESCSNIGNEGLQAIGQNCQKLKSISIKNCSQVGDQAIANLLSSSSSSSSSYSLMKLNLESLNISDMSLAVIGHYGIEITDLALTSLRKVTEKGFWVMGSGQGLQKLKSLTISSCFGVTDLVLEALGRGCPNLKQFALRKSAFLSDNGIVSFAELALSLETILLEECHRVTQCGIFNMVLKSKLKNLALENCFGIKDSVPAIPFRCSDSVESLSIRNCPGFGNRNLMLFGRICPRLQNIEFTGLNEITDDGLAPLVESCESGLVTVSLSSCPKLTDKLVSELCKIHGGTLEILNLDGCTSITDSSLVSIASECLLLTELDVSGSGITDSGVTALACAVQLNLQILSIANCRFVSDKSLPFLMKLGESLVGLNIQQCHGISNSGVGIMVDHLWNCDILS